MVYNSGFTGQINVTNNVVHYGSSGQINATNYVVHCGSSGQINATDNVVYSGPLSWLTLKYASSLLSSCFLPKE